MLLLDCRFLDYTYPSSRGIIRMKIRITLYKRQSEIFDNPLIHLLFLKHAMQLYLYMYTLLKVNK